MNETNWLPVTNLTPEYFQYRTSYKQSLNRFGPCSVVTNQSNASKYEPQLLASCSKTALNTTETPYITIELREKYASPPTWLDSVEDVNEEIIRAKELLSQVMGQLNLKTNNSLNLDHSKASATLKLNEIQNILKQCQAKLQSFPSMTACNNVEKELQKNLHTSLLLKINDLLDSVNTIKPTLTDSNKRNNAEKNVKSNYAEDSSIKEDFQFKTLKPGKQGYGIALPHDPSNEDIQDVNKLVQSAQELNTLFTKMSTGVALQGSLMDRIDYLVDEGVGNVERGKDELVKVEKKRYMKRASRLILTLSLLDIILAGLVLLKLHKRFA